MRLYLADLPGRNAWTFETNAFREGLKILLSYAFIDPNNYRTSPYGPGLKNVKAWALDSGAFTAHSKGTKVDHEHYIEYAKSSGADEVFGWYALRSLSG